MSLSKHMKLDYWECYAKIVLEYFFPERYSNLTLSDKPDLICEINETGIEVTSAIPRDKREAETLWIDIPNVDNEKKKYNIERMEQLGYKYTGGIQFWNINSFDVSPSIAHKQFAPFFSIFERKVKKLNSGNYKILSQYDLFIHSEMHILDMQCENILNELIKLNNGYRYVYVTTNTNDLYIFNLYENTWLKVDDKIFDKYQSIFSKKANKLVELGEQ